MNERELMRGYRVDPNSLTPRGERRHVDMHPFAITERPLPRKRCPGPNCLTLTTAHLCQYCQRSRELDPIAFREAMGRQHANRLT